MARRTFHKDTPEYRHGLETGSKPAKGMFEAISINRHGEYIRSRHNDPETAQKRLNGVRRHTGHQIIDHRPRNALGELI